MAFKNRIIMSKAKERLLLRIRQLFFCESNQVYDCENLLPREIFQWTVKERTFASLYFIFLVMFVSMFLFIYFNM